MAHLNDFTYGAITPVLAYAVSFLGSLLGLRSTVRARESTDPRQRARWLALAAWAIGGTAIWVMHFLAMLGFTIDEGTVRYDPAVTIASWLTAVIVVGVGLFIVGYGRRSVLKVLAGGLFTGLGVAAMHYTGMAAMRVNGAVQYDSQLKLASVVIAVVAATVALWFTVVIRSAAATAGAAAIMGLAVCGMHYTGMAALRVHMRTDPATVNGVPATVFLVPIFVFVLLVALALVYAMMATPSGQDTAAQSEFLARLSAPAQATPASGAGSLFDAGGTRGEADRRR